jgi:hypothetical protein
MTENKESMLKQIICGVVIVLISGWIGYISLKGSTLDAMAAGLNTRVTVLESVTSTIRGDISEIKSLIKQVRDDQIRRETREKK